MGILTYTRGTRRFDGHEDRGWERHYCASAAPKPIASPPATPALSSLIEYLGLLLDILCGHRNSFLALLYDKGCEITLHQHHCRVVNANPSFKLRGTVRARIMGGSTVLGFVSQV
ncbi:hypothetical protein Pcinc_008128 [Petrolisthes cinctipes]|uniref:Uncharacterized protein n=1 Tax=Petrolisthes cinctipes TaxID=88211 RepID=A0AAE1KZT7_PETCI|nr:hypothetical protein Pcinc_008128 [Petrolisthes cinctipes]